MRRAIIIVLDSLGIGSTEDSYIYNDKGSNTLGHISENIKLKIPNLIKLGLIKTLEFSSGSIYGFSKKDVIENNEIIGAYGYAKEISKGKDTVSGHWEIAGCPVLKDWGYFTNFNNSFPEELLNNISIKANLKGFLGNCHASGTQILKKLGEEHIKTGYPIFYTSADSVFQIAAHEEIFGLENLYDLCLLVRKEVDKYNIGRVIARPFVGNCAENFNRTANRKDYAIPPFNNTLLDIAKNNNITVVAIGKTGDIFTNRGINECLKTPWNEGGINNTIQALKKYKHNSLIFTNLSDFDVLYGHRRDPKGYGEAINYFDSRIPQILNNLYDEDLLIITADHGNDPTWQGTDHTREHIPILVYSKHIKAGYIGKRNTFSDIAQTIAEHLNLPKLQHGTSFYEQIKK